MESEGSTGAEFFEQLSDCKSKPDITPEENLFIDCLLASADYDSFYSVMIKEAKKNIIMRNAGKMADEAEAKFEEDGGGFEDGGDDKGGDEK